MKTAMVVLGLFFCVLSVRSEQVVLTLKNGDRISGELISENDERITVRSPFAGKLRIPKADVSKRELPTPATPTPAAVVSGPPVPTNRPASLVATPPAPVKGTNDVSALGKLAPSWSRPFLTNWHGNVQLGMDLGFGTSDRETFYANASAAHSWNRLRNLADLHSAYGSVNHVESANRMDGSLKTDVDLWKQRRLYAYNQGGAGYDFIRRVDLEFNEGAGMGYKLLQRPKLVINSELGMQYQFQDFQNTTDRSFFSLRLGENLSWRLLDKLSLTQRLAYTPDIEDFEEFRVRFELGLSYPLFKRVTLNLNVIDQYDSRPANGVDRNDLQVQSTLGVTF